MIVLLWKLGGQCRTEEIISKFSCTWRMEIITVSTTILQEFNFFFTSVTHSLIFMSSVLLLLLFLMNMLFLQIKLGNLIRKKSLWQSPENSYWPRKILLRYVFLFCDSGAHVSHPWFQMQSRRAQSIKHFGTI